MDRPIPPTVLRPARTATARRSGAQKGPGSHPGVPPSMAITLAVQPPGPVTTRHGPRRRSAGQLQLDRLPSMAAEPADLFPGFLTRALDGRQPPYSARHRYACGTLWPAAAPCSRLT